MIEIMQDILNKMNDSQRRIFLLTTSLISNIEVVWQVRNCRVRLESGFLLQTRGRIMTLPVNRTTEERRGGSSKVLLVQDGRHPAQIRIYGFTEYVSV